MKFNYIAFMFLVMYAPIAMSKPNSEVIRRERFTYGYKIIETTVTALQIKGNTPWGFDEWLQVPLRKITEMVETKRRNIPDLESFKLHKCSLIHSEALDCWYYELEYQLIWNGKVSGVAFFFVTSESIVIEPKFTPRDDIKPPK